MSLTKATYAMIQGAPYNVFDYMTAEQIADVSSFTGSIDVTAAINAALAAPPNQHTPTWQPYVLYFPPGKYLVTDTIVISDQYSSAYMGYGAEIIGDFDKPIIQFGSATNQGPGGNMWSSFQGFQIINKATSTNAKAMTVLSVYSCSFVDCFFIGGKDTMYHQGNNNVFLQCTFRSFSGTNSERGFVGSDSANNENLTLQNCAFELYSNAGTWLATDTGYAGQTNIFSCYWEQCTQKCLYIKNSNMVLVEGCYFNVGTTVGILLDGGIGPDYDLNDVRIIIKDNQVYGDSPSVFIKENSSTAVNCIYSNTALVSSSVVNLYDNAPNSINGNRLNLQPFIANTQYFTKTSPATVPDGWSLGGSGTVNTSTQFSPYGAGASVQLTATNSYIYQEVKAPINTLLKITCYAKSSDSSTVAQIQAYNQALNTEISSSNTITNSVAKLTMIVKPRASETSFNFLLRHVSGSGTVEFCNIVVENFTE